MKLLSKG